MTRRIALLATTCALVATAPATAQGPDVVIPATGAEYMGSDNVELVGQIKTVGDGVGATIVGNIMFVTTTKSLSVFDITNAENPRPLGISTRSVEFENEEVPTNGKVLGISSEIGCGEQPTESACLDIYDVRDPSAVKYLTTVPESGEHTSGCVLDCQYFYGSSGSITDARTVLEGGGAKRVGDWRTAFPDGTLSGGCHHVREVAPGYLLGSCQPVILMSVLAKDGGSPLKPVIIATGDSKREVYIHSSRWPRQGKDRWVLVGEETNAQPQCTDTVAAFMTFDAAGMLDPNRNFITGGKMILTDEVRPTQGNYADGNTPVNALGCSVHWFEEHPTFNDGGLVALAEYENGTRLYQVRPDGKLVEQGFYLPAGGSASAPHWHPNGKVFYSIDYTRGVDIVRYTGENYVPTESGIVAPTPGATPGTGGQPTPAAAPCATASGFSSVAANPLDEGLRFTVGRRTEKSYDVDVVQVSQGRSVLTGKVRARFRDVKDDFVWNGEGLGGRSLKDGYYVVKLTMALDGGVKDVRYLAYQRNDDSFKLVAKRYRQETNCGEFKTQALSSPVFGGKTKQQLVITYELERGAEDVTLEALVGRKVVKRFKTAGDDADRRYRLKLPAKAVKAGKTVRLRWTVETGTDTPAVTELFAKRI